jgi:hypothetical protein
VPGYGAPMPGYGAPMPGYGAPMPGYGVPVGGPLPSAYGVPRPGGAVAPFPPMGMPPTSAPAKPPVRTGLDALDPFA